MDNNALAHGAVTFLAFVGLVTFHEFAHAWTACRCGDDTPRLQGRVTLDPLAHIDWLGTIVLPLIVTFIGAMNGQTMLFGWGKPVQVNPLNFRERRWHDILVSGAGPAMNLLLAFVLLGGLKIAQWGGASNGLLNELLSLPKLSLFLCFFNLLPVPPLDGGHILRNLIGMSDEVYQMMSRYSFLFLVLIMRSPAVGEFIGTMTNSALMLLALPFGWHLSWT